MNPLPELSAEWMRLIDERDEVICAAVRAECGPDTDVGVWLSVLWRRLAAAYHIDGEPPSG